MARIGLVGVSLIACAIAAPPARGEALELRQVLTFAGTALSVLMADAEYHAAHNDWERAKTEKGWKLSVHAGYGTERDLIDEIRARDFEAIRSEVKVSYPLLGALAREERDVETAAGRMAEATIQRDAARRIAELHLEDVYAAYWGAQESLDVVAAYLALGDRAGDGAARARSDERRLGSRRSAARARLEQLADRKFTGLIASGVQLPAVPALEPQRLERDHPELAAIRALYNSTRAQLDGSVWYGIGAEFDLTQTTLQDRDSGQAGNALFANITVQLPLTFYAAGLSERRKLRAEMQFLEFKLRDKGAEIVARAQETEAEHLDLADEVEVAAERARVAGRALHDARGGASAAALREYYALALKEIDARTRFWRSHVAMRSFVPVGAAEPAPEPTGPTSADVGTRLSGPFVAARGG
jgi:hypothetical protein